MAKNKTARKEVRKRPKVNRRRVRYSVAMSLDGFIAGPKGEYDWIIMDPSLDFAALFKQFDTVLMGRRTFEFTQQSGGGMVAICKRSCSLAPSGKAITRRSSSAARWRRQSRPAKPLPTGIVLLSYALKKG
jgi:dihydrofolate reductase